MIEDANTANGTLKGDNANDPAIPSVAADPRPATVDPMVLDEVTQTANQVLGQAAKTADSIAYQKVTQAASLAVQDATDYLRNMMTVFATAQGKAAQLFLETKDPAYLELLGKAESAVKNATDNLQLVGQVAVGVAKDFPA